VGSQKQEQQPIPASSSSSSSSAVISLRTEPQLSAGRISRSASTDDSGGFADSGFKMPENFDIPQDYIQQIVPKRTPGKKSFGFFNL
jgi:hypothetical protein